MFSFIYDSPLFNVNDKAFHWFQIWAEHHVQAKDIKPEAEDRNLDKSRMMDEKDHTIKEWDQVFIDKNVMQKETQTEKQGCQALIELVMVNYFLSVACLFRFELTISFFMFFRPQITCRSHHYMI